MGLLCWQHMDSQTIQHHTLHMDQWAQDYDVLGKT